MSARTPVDRLADALYLGAGGLLVYALLAWGLSHPAFALHRLEVSGQLRHVDAASVKRVASRGIRGNFFTVDLDDVREAFEKLPWVKQARIARYWPDTLRVELVEHMPLARWNGEALLSVEGVVIDATPAAELPALNGFEGSGEEVADAFRRFNQALAPIGMRIAELSFSPRRAWRLRTAEGLEIALGRVEPEARLVRFARLYARMTEVLGTRPAYVDLRYADGFAVRPAHGREIADQSS